MVRKVIYGLLVTGQALLFAYGVYLQFKSEGMPYSSEASIYVKSAVAAGLFIFVLMSIIRRK